MYTLRTRVVATLRRRALGITGILGGCLAGVCDCVQKTYSPWPPWCGVVVPDLLVAAFSAPLSHACGGIRVCPSFEFGFLPCYPRGAASMCPTSFRRLGVLVVAFSAPLSRMEGCVTKDNR